MALAKIIVKGRLYAIEKIFYRTKGSSGQTMVDNKNKKNIEEYAKYYLVHAGGKRYWIKQIWFPDTSYKHFPDKTNHKNEIMKEFDNIRRNDFLVNCDGSTITAIKAVDYEKDKLVTEYCEGYSRYTKHKGNGANKIIIRTLLLKWASQLKLKNYDMNKNNILIKKDGKGKIHIKMVDFADSYNKPISMCESFIRSITK